MQHVILNIYNSDSYNMSVLERAIGWLAPADCVSCGQEGSSLCLICSEAEILPFGERCFLCNKMSRDSVTCEKCRKGTVKKVWITTDYEDTAKKLVQVLKFGHQRAAAGVIAGMMSDTLNESVSMDDMTRQNFLVIPVPTASARIRERSFDHTQLVAQRIAKLNKLPYAGLLKRLGNTRQVGSKRSARLNQAQGQYYVPNNKALTGRNILLVDDVVTTGATLQAAYIALKNAGAKNVDALVFAKKL